MATIGFAMIVKNEEATIRMTLESIAWADEIVVVIDSKSSDATESIVREYTDKVYVQEWLGYGKQRNVSLEKMTTDWIFIIDGDEYLSPELAQELRVCDERYDGYEIYRSIRIGDIHLKGPCHNPYNLRLFKRSSASYNDNFVHEQLVFHESPRIGRLKNKFIHYFLHMHDWLANYNSYTTLEAKKRVVFENKTYSKVGLLCRMWWAFPDMFIVTFIKKKSYRDGVLGIVMSGLRGMYKFLEYVKIYELLYMKSRQSIKK